MSSLHYDIGRYQLRLHGSCPVLVVTDTLPAGLVAWPRTKLTLRKTSISFAAIGVLAVEMEAKPKH